MKPARFDIDALIEIRVRELVDLRLAERLGAIESDPWIDQDASPLGRKLHCRLVRGGELDGRKVGRKVLVRRSALDRFVDAHPIAAAPAPRAETDALDGQLAALGFDEPAPKLRLVRKAVRS